MRNLMKLAIGEAYSQSPFDENNIPYQQIVEYLHKYNTKQIIKIVATSHMRLKIKKSVKYFLTHVLKTIPDQLNKNKKDIKPVSPGENSTILEPHSACRNDEQEIKLVSSGKNSTILETHSACDNDEQISFEEMTQKVFNIIEETDNEFTNKIFLEIPSEEFVSIIEGSNSEKFSFNLSEFDDSYSEAKIMTSTGINENDIHYLERNSEVPIDISEEFISVIDESGTEKFSFNFSEFNDSHSEMTVNEDAIKFLEKRNSKQNIQIVYDQDDPHETSPKDCDAKKDDPHKTNPNNKTNIFLNVSACFNKFKSNSNSSNSFDSAKNDNNISIDRLINESSLYDKIGSPDLSFAGVSVLKNIRKKYLTPDILQHLNINVRMVEGQKTNRNYKFHCPIQDAKLHMPEIGEVLKNNNTEISTKKLLEDFIRIGYLTRNNACDINFKHTRINKDSFVAYGYCTDLECSLFIFNGDMNGTISVFKSQNEVVHSIDKKNTFQCRGAQRYLEKSEISNETALKYEMRKINQQSDELRLVGRSQMIKSLSNIRNIKAEADAQEDNHPDPFIDSYLMFKTEPKKYIQHLSTNFEAFLWSKKQVEILRKHNDFILKKINYTLHVDATGHVVDNMDFPTKRIFAYSLVGHIREKNLIFSVADAVLSNHSIYDIGHVFKCLKSFCKTNKIKFPICKRMVTDISAAIIGAIIREINDMRGMLDYLNACYDVLNKSRKLSFVIIQFCASHQSKIICKDIDNAVPLSNVELRTFLREAFGIVFNLNTLSECLEWFKEITTVLCTQKHTKKVNDALTYLKKASSCVKDSIKKEDEEQDVEQEEYLYSQSDKTMGNISKLSPFCPLFDKYKAEIDTCDTEESITNKFFCPEITELLMEKYIPFIPMWSNIMGIIIDNSGCRVSNGPIETYFKDLKRNYLKGKKHKLGRFIRIMRKSTKARTKKIQISYKDVFDKEIPSGTLITPSKIKRKTKKVIKPKKTILEIDSKRKLSKITESWNKKLKRLPHGLFNKSFKMVDNSMAEFDKLSLEIENVPNNENNYKDETLIKKNVSIELDENSNMQLNENVVHNSNETCKKNVSNALNNGLIVLEDNSNINESTEVISTDLLTDSSSQCNYEATKEIKSIPLLERQHKNLESCVGSNFNFFLLKLESLFEQTHGKQFSLTSYITLAELDTLNNNNWLSTTIVDACITCIMFENKNVRCSYIACQINDYCFQNERLLFNNFSKRLQKLIIPHCYHHHFYIVFIDFDECYILCMDPKGNKQNCSIFIDYYLNILSNHFPNVKWTSKTVEQDMQKDAWNCGIFIIQFAERFLQSQSFTNLDDQDNYRLAIKKKLYTYGDPIAHICLHCGHDTFKSIKKLCCSVCFRFVCTFCKKHYGTLRSNVNNITFKCKLCED